MTTQDGDAYYVFDLTNVDGTGKALPLGVDYTMTAFLSTGQRWTIHSRITQYPFRPEIGGIYVADKNDPGIAAFIEHVEANRLDLSERLLRSGDQEVELTCVTTPGLFLTVGPVVECEIKPTT